MKITLAGTGIFAPDLKEQLLPQLKARLGELDLEKTYKLELLFDEITLRDTGRMTSFSIPREALLRYLQDRKLTGEEKRSQLLSYQLGQAAACLDELGIRAWHFAVTGLMLSDPDSLVLELEEGETFGTEKPEGAKRKKKGMDPPPRVFSIMPSMRGFERNLASLAERWTDELVQAFGSRELYEKYKVVLGWEKLRDILSRFREEYGSGFFGLKEEKGRLQAEFLRMVKEAEKEADGAGAAGAAGQRSKAAAGDVPGSAGDDRAAAETAPPHSGSLPAGERVSRGTQASRGTQDSGKTAKDRAVICRLPVFAKTKTGRKSRRQAGWVLLETDGRGFWLRWEKEPSGENAVRLPEETGNIGETAKSSEAILAEIRRLAGEAREMLDGPGYVLETEPVDQILAFTDLKKMLRKIRRDLLLKQEDR